MQYYIGGGFRGRYTDVVASPLIETKDAGYADSAAAGLADRTAVGESYRFMNMPQVFTISSE